MKMEEMSLSGLDNSKLEVRAPPRVPLVLSLDVSTLLYLTSKPKRNLGSQPCSLNGIGPAERPKDSEERRRSQDGRNGKESIIFGQAQLARDLVGERGFQSTGL